MKAKWNTICDEQIQIGKNYKTQLRNLEKFYHQQIIETNRQLEQLIKQRAIENGEDLIIVRVEYYNVYGQSCDVDALWLSTEPVGIPQRVSLFDNTIHGRGKFDGLVKRVFRERVSEKEYSTVACPLNHRKIWSAEEMV